MEDFKKLRGISFLTLYDTSELTVMKKYGVNAIPTTFLIDRKGYVRKIWLGYKSSWQDEFRKEILKYLKEE